MAKYLGELLLRSEDNSDQFYQHTVFASSITDELETAMLEDPTYINGYQADGNESVLVDDLPDLAMIPLNIEKGNEIIKAIYRDAGNENAQYDVIVYLLVEETDRDAGQ